MTALGMYEGANTPEEHAKESARLGGDDAYRVRLVNALLGQVQTEALLADGVPLNDEARYAAWEEQLASAGAGVDYPVKRIEFIRWQVLLRIPAIVIAEIDPSRSPRSAHRDRSAATLAVC